MAGSEDILERFLPPVREWFLDALGQPTPPQALGWPPIMRGEHTLILAPTGSGKTLAAFLWGINRLFAELQAGTLHPGVDLLYVSPLKALNNDIERNLHAPIEGSLAKAKAAGVTLPPILVAVRTGDTPSSARVAMVKRPPHILITTPESLYIMLTSEQARQTFRHIRTVIVDEIHTMVGSKRGVHLALSLERLEHLRGAPVQRIGLSATIRPLEEVARFLGGQELSGGEARPCPVTIVDAGYRKPMDLRVVGLPMETPNEIKEGGGLWANLVPRVLELVRQHKTSLIFCNNRRLAERTADRLNEQFFAEESEEAPPGSSEALAPGGVPRGLGLMGITSRGGPFRAHHASMSKEARLKMEQDLKEGRLPALVGTSSLELGIDMGSIDLVAQVQSPKGVTQGLQRVGRSGHLVGQTSVGRIFPTHSQDLLEAAAVARGMARGDVEATHTPQNCLDVLAQQVVAAVAVETWDVRELYDLLRQSYPYRDLPWEAFQRVLEMLSGKYPSEVSRALRPRIVWDRVNNRLAALPGARLVSVTNGGTISDRGAFAVYLADGVTRIGELDEEFVFETRVGDVFILGSQVWRAIEITQDRVVVADAAGSLPRVPFWRGDMPWRSYNLSLEVGRLRREIAERLADAGVATSGEPPLELVRWLMDEYLLDEYAARQALGHVQRQLDSVGAISSDRTVVVEAFQDAVGDYRIVVHAPFGGRVNGPLALALARSLRKRLGLEPEVQVDDDGILFRLPAFDGELPLDMLERLSPVEARERILAELPESALFGATFRQNAARALLLPGLGPRRRTPFWLQRLRAKDLLAAVKAFPDFPILTETYRDCIAEAMDLPHVEEVLGRIRSGEIRVVVVESDAPSPEASGLLFDFINTYMYEWDEPKAARAVSSLAPDRELLAGLLADPALARIIRPEAAQATLERVQRIGEGCGARTVEELALFLEETGDLSVEEVAARCAGHGPAWLRELAAAGRVSLARIGGQRRWVSAERLREYQHAFGEAPSEEARLAVLKRFLSRSGPVTLAEIQARYPLPTTWLEQALDGLVAAREAVRSRFTPDAQSDQWCDRRIVEQMRRQTLALLRKEVQPVAFHQYAYFLARFQHLHPGERLEGRQGLAAVLGQLQVCPVVGQVWERDVLPGRVRDFQPSLLEEMCASGELAWVGAGGADASRGKFRLLLRGEGHALLPEPGQVELSAQAQDVLRFLQLEGSVTARDLRDALGLDAPTLWRVLIELALAGLATNSTWQAFRDLLAGGPPQAPSAPASSLEAELASRRRGPRRLTLSRRAEIRRRLTRELQRAPTWTGLWSPVRRFAVMGRELAPEERAERQARQLLDRYGIVSRLCLEWEESGWEWTPIAQQLQLMEYRGQARRGYFVRGLPGLQYASPEVVERLREWSAAESDDAVAVLNACDPAHVYPLDAASGGEATPTVLARLPTNYLCQTGGRPVLWAEGGGARLSVAAGQPLERVREAVTALLDVLTAPGGLASSPRRVTVTHWNDTPVLQSDGREPLASLGFRRDLRSMIWYQSVSR